MIIEKLKELQGNLTDQEFADKLGIHRVSWQRIKNRRVPVSDKFLVRIHRAFPNMEIFLTDDVQIGKGDVLPITTTTPETSQDGKSAGFRHLCSAFLYRLKSWFCYPKATTDTKNK